MSGIVLLLAATPLLAHHSRAMYDMTRNVTYRGVVQEYRWENPHSHVVITVAPGAADPATVGTWDVEASSVNVMESGGWTRDSFKPGDAITIVGHPMKKASTSVLMFYVIKPDGTRLYRGQHRYPSETE